MPILTAQVSIPHDSALPEDVVINTFHFLTSAGADDIQIQAQADGIPARLLKFYNDIHAPGTVAIKTYLASTLNPPGAILKIYNRAHAIPRAPIYEAPLAIGSGGTTALPHEVALCLSYQALRQSGAAQVNRRGRMFLGPWVASVNESGSGVARPSGALINAVAGAASALATIPTAGAAWCVFSRTQNLGHIVSDGWVDNAWDIQRRRGERASSRQVWT